MMEEFTERDLSRKFVERWHLNVPERKALPAGSLRGSLLVKEVCLLVCETGWYPVDWRPDKGFDGGLIEQIDGGGCKVYWKVECGVARFTLQDVKEYKSLEEGARAYAIKFFGDNFDDIPIDWSR